MPDEQQPDYASGGVPHAYRNVIFWRWTRTMPRPLKGPFLTLLYALGAAASTHGLLQFRDGTVIRIQDIAAGVGSDEKDTRRYLNAAIAAGVVAVEGERGRGKRAVYRIVVCLTPDWTAALASLADSKPKPKKSPAPAPWQDAEKFGGPTPVVTGRSSGDRPPNSAGQSSGDHPPTEFGGPSPEWFGGPTPEQPRGTQVLPQEMADVGGDVSLGVAPEELCEPPDDVEFGSSEQPEDDPFDADAPGSWPQPSLTLTSQGRRDARAAEVKAKSASSRGQMPLLLSVRDPEHVATAAAVREAAAQDPDLVRRAIRELGVTDAIRLYGHRLVAPHLTDQTDTA
ncbi:hypothetical protein ACFWCB_26220 [Streptomyces sp. NPDC060048]|uniref:hypothetical protein n=1 Tax=unclassified Streptomyces TaxID=2593676 RepID=UPI0036CD05AC